MQLALWNELLLLIETIFKSKDNIRKETESFISNRGFEIVSLNIITTAIAYVAGCTVYSSLVSLSP